jgi:hypothetical protein
LGIFERTEIGAWGQTNNDGQIVRSQDLSIVGQGRNAGALEGAPLLQISRAVFQVFFVVGIGVE